MLQNTSKTICGLYYNPMTIINDDSRVVNKLETPLTDDARVVIYDRHMFIVPATSARKWQLVCLKGTARFILCC